MTKPPAYQHYARDCIVETAHLTLEQQGAYHRLQDHQWIEGPLPRKDADLARRLGVPAAKFKKLWAVISQFFPVTADGLHVADKRIEHTREEQAAFFETQRKNGQAGAAVRWKKKRRADHIATPLAEAERPHSDPTGDGIATPMPEPMAENSSASASASALKSKTKLSRGTTPGSKDKPDTWVTPFGVAWLAIYPDGVPPWGQLARYLRPLTVKHETSVICARLVEYFQREGQYASLPRFAATFGDETRKPSAEDTAILGAVRDQHRRLLS